MKAQLVPLEGGKTITLSKDVTLVGRKRDLCDLIINASSVSKLQCLIVKTDGLLFIRDLCSTNGTTVNGQRVTRGALLPGDELAFAGTRFRVHLGPGDAADDADPETELLDSLSDSTNFEQLEAEDDEAGSDSDVRLLPDDSSA